jgi:hypothetical protein
MPIRPLPAALLAFLLLSLGACARKPTGAEADVKKGDETRKEEQDEGPPLFEDVTAASGIDFSYRNGEDTADHLSILESLGGGVALIDYDGDGLLDVFLPGGGGFAGPDKKQIVGRPCKLYRNLGKRKFKDVTADVGLDKLAGGKPWFYTHGAAVADVDRDGRPDLLVTGWGRVALFRNIDGKRFEDVTEKSGLVEGITWATSAAFADLDGDGTPDLYLCQYVNWSFANNPACSYDGKTPDVCPPKNFSGLPHKLFLNDGKGKFRDVSAEAGLKPGGPDASKGLGVVIVDVDGDGKPDIYVCNDTVDNFLYVNKSERGKLRFEERGLTSGSARDDRGAANGSMGADAGDYDGSGKPAIWVTNYENELHALYRNECRPGRVFFTHRTTAAGIAAVGQKYVGWGTAFLDADLDGREDLFVANGHAIRYPTGKGVNRRQEPVLLMNHGSKFRSAGRRLGDYGAQPHLARGVGFGDLDNDGRTDLVISHVNEPAAVLRGIGGEGRHWLGVGLEGKGHGCAVGARAVFEAGDLKLTRFVKGGGSYASSGDRRLLFGLGDQTKGRLTVHWPDGTQEQFDGLAVDRYYRIVQGEKKAAEFPAGAK